MKTFSLIMLAAMSAIPLSAQSAKEVADSLQMPELKAGDTVFKVPQVQGAKVKILGADYEQIIDEDGKISPVISDTPVQISFEVKKGSDTAVSKDYSIIVRAQEEAGADVNPKPDTVPALLEWKGSKGELVPGKFSVQASKGISSLPVKEIESELNGMLDKNAEPKETVLKLNLIKESPYNLGKEGYELKISHNGVSINACTETALYWGTRTVLQILASNGGKLPCGRAIDFPRFSVRGFMLDVGRVPVPLSTLYDVVRTMAWYKMNDFHVHLNDNYIFHEEYVDAGKDPFEESYDGFRLESSIKGKNGRTLHSQDLHYSKADFAKFIEFAKARGVQIVPEFDTPAHALSFTRIRPDLIYQGPMSKPKRRCEMLDAANPGTVKFVSKVWDEYLKPDRKLKKAVFDGCTVHIGADEFYGSNEDYRKYMDSLIKFVKSRGYTPRVWGSLNQKKGKTKIDAEGVQLNLWNGGWAKAWDSINDGYDVINTQDGALYIVPFANYYLPGALGAYVYDKFVPNKYAGEVVPAGHPQMLGACFAIWNDNTDRRYTGYSSYEMWPMFSQSADIMGEKTWGPEKTPRAFPQHRELVDRIGTAPGCNPLHLVDWTHYEYNQPATGPVSLKKGAVGPNYHLTMELKLNKAPKGQEQVLLKAPQGEFIAVMKDGTVGFRRDDSVEFSFEYKLPVGKQVKLELIGTSGNTELLIDGQKVGNLTIKTINKENRSQGLHSTFILPLDVLCPSFNGEVSKLQVEVTKPVSGATPSAGGDKAPTEGVGTPGSDI